ncbi:hypothetical protein VB711_16960 [Cronbergia sp. UHCC 0137]|uniref:hypothetical protein n=1 Tax=Cronbergia sp. UHCC 0137 TaxID=3110239 RepID=UPI002B1E9617|nr:hypothetical protein [Cronbergia sp. UHCC 0137]MEA5619517.1 hypothetical protein [Cronbergia sp. UHCC 0137]
MALTELQDSDKWSLVWEDSQQTQPYPPPFDNLWEPLAPFNCPLLLTGKALLIKNIVPIPEDVNWYFGGNAYIYQSFPVLNTVPALVLRRRLQINDTTIFTIPEIAPQYSLTIKDAYWVRNQTVQVYEYIGA